MYKILQNNSGSENMTNVIWIAVAFVVGGICLTIMHGLFEDTIKPWLEKIAIDWFGKATSKSYKSAGGGSNISSGGGADSGGAQIISINTNFPDLSIPGYSFNPLI